MKNFLFIFSLVWSFQICIFAQLYMNHEGSLGLGTMPLGNAKMYLNGYGGNGLYSANNSMHILIQNNCRVSSTNYGININNWLNDSITTCGVRAYAMGGGLLNSANYGVMGYGAFSNVMACGIYGGLRPLHVTCGAGVFGSANSVKIIDQNTYGGLYAGFFLGDVRVTGTLYANVLTPSALLNSKNSKQESMIQVVSSDNDIEETSVTEKLRKIGAADKPCGGGSADVNPKLLLNDT